MPTTPYQKPSYPRPELPAQEVALLPEEYARAVVKDPFYGPYAVPWADLKHQQYLHPLRGFYGYCVLCGCPLKDFTTHAWTNADLALCKACGSLPLWRVKSSGGLRFTSAEFYAHDLGLSLPPPNRDLSSYQEQVRYHAGRRFLRAWKKDLKTRKKEEKARDRYKLKHKATLEYYEDRTHNIEAEEASWRRARKGPLPKRGSRLLACPVKIFTSPLPQLARPELPPREVYLNQQRPVEFFFLKHGKLRQKVYPVTDNHCYYCGHPFPIPHDEWSKNHPAYGPCMACAEQPLYTVIFNKQDRGEKVYKTVANILFPVYMLKTDECFFLDGETLLSRKGFVLMALPQAELLIESYKPFMELKDKLATLEAFEADNAAFPPEID